MKNQRGSAKSLFIIVALVVIVGGFVIFQLTNKKPSTTSQNTQKTQEQKSSGTSIFDRLFGIGGSSNQSTSSNSGGGSIFDKLFSSGGSSNQGASNSGGTSIFDKLFSSGSSNQGASNSGGSTGGGSIFDKLFSSGSNSSGIENVGVDTEVSTSSDSAPFRTNASPSGDVPYYTKETNISLNTNKVAVCRYSTIQGMAYGQMLPFSTTGSTFHSTQVTGLSEDQQYTYYVKCQDLAGHTNTVDFIISFHVDAYQSTNPPVRTNPYPSGDVFPAGTQSTLISIVTNEAANCRYATEQGQDYNSMYYNFNNNTSTSTYHSATYYGLENGKSYSLFVRCESTSGIANTGDVKISFSVSN